MPRWSDGETASRPALGSAAGADGSDDDRRLFVFDDGRVGVFSPPRGKLTRSRLAFLGEGKSVPLAFPDLPPDVEHALESGVWLDGFEERRAGVVSGWVDAAGAMIGVDIEEGGWVRVGDYVRDAGDPVISGRYGLGWGDANRAYETTNGGATWTLVSVPKPLSRSPGPETRACGPVGCTAKGWIRVGWGKAKASSSDAVAANRVPFRPPPDLDLVCEPDTTGNAKPAEAFDAFSAAEEPSPRRGELRIGVDATDSIDRAGRPGFLARIDAWGPRSGDWGHDGRWAVRWLSPYGDSPEVRATAASLAPFPSPDAAKRALGHSGSGSIVNWTMAIGDDSTSALLVGRRLGLDPTILELDAEKDPVVVRRGDGNPFGEIDFALKAEGRWYLASREDYGEPQAAVVFRVDEGRAREFARAPRATRDLRPSTARLAVRSDGRAIGLVVDGQPPPDRAIPLRWVLPLDLESGASGEPELLGAADLGDRRTLFPCKETDTGWILDTAWAGKVHIAMLGSIRLEELNKVYFRVRLSTGGACVERLLGSFAADSRGGGGDSVSPKWTPPGVLSHERASLVISAMREGKRSLLRCEAR